MMSARIIVVEDERLTRAGMVEALRRAGHNVRAASDAQACRAALKAERADLVILDLGLPGEDGLSYARELSASGELAVLVVTARKAAEVQVAALDGGADGFLVKPVEAEALAAHVRAVLRRKSLARPGRMRFSGWVLDLERRILVGEEEQIIVLTRGEFSLLALLAQAEGRIVSRELLSEAVNRGDRSEEPRDIRSVDALVSRLRRKLTPALIGTAPGFGYRLCAKVEKE